MIKKSKMYGNQENYSKMFKVNPTNSDEISLLSNQGESL